MHCMRSFGSDAKLPIAPGTDIYASSASSVLTISRAVSRAEQRWVDLSVQVCSPPGDLASIAVYAATVESEKYMGCMRFGRG